MPIVLFRVDERLIHGQVTVGWGSVLHPGRYLVVDDDLAESDWEAEIHRLGVPPEAEAVFLAVGDARTRLNEFRREREVTVVLTRSIPVMAELARDGALAGEEVNLGGVHHAPGRARVLSYLHLGESDRDAIRTLRDEGVSVSARDLPHSPPIRLKRLLESS